jgi:EmrB/QacA subfamily drug resistance transporter
MLVLMVGSFMSVLDSSIVNTAIPTMQKDLGASADDIEWVSTGYTLALAVVVPLSNWLGDRVGATLTHRLSMISFAAASALCGLAWNLDSMIGFRVLQAMAGGILPVVTLTILYKIVPMEKIGSAMGLYGLGVVVAPAIGPTLGGYLVEYVDWRLIFYINVPIGILGAIAAYFVLPTMPKAETHPFDWFGFLTIGYGLFGLLLAVSKGQDWGWTSYGVLILLVTAVLSLALFAVIENEVEYPLINLKVLKNWAFVNSLLIISVLSVGLFATSFYLPQFLQNAQGLTPLNAGLLLLPQALVMAVLMPLAGTVYDRFGPKWPALIGLAIAAYGTYLLSGINLDMTRQEVIGWTIVRAIGNGLAMMPVMTAGLNSLPRTMSGTGSAVNNIAQRVSSSLGLAGLGVLVTTQTAQLTADQGALLQTGNPQVQQIQQEGTSAMYGLYQQVQLHAQATAYGEVFLVAAALTAVCVLLAVTLKRPVPATTPTAAPATAARATVPAVRTTATPVEVVDVVEAPGAPGAPLPTTEFRPDLDPAHAGGRTADARPRREELEPAGR